MVEWPLVVGVATAVVAHNLFEPEELGSGAAY